ncbi:Dynamin-related protein 3A [Linum grandiflorum]
MVDLATMAEEPASQSPPTAAPLGSSVIPMVNKLQDIFAQLGSQSTIDLPQVAVVGSQSSGKSSVLEALVGRDFLPRGNEICTRRPLVLQLVQTKRKGDGSEEEWGEFLHRPDKRYYDFSEIRREIEAVTAKEAGDNKGVSDKQIRLKIFSPTVLDITLVDLPGITKVPVGDQPTDIEAKIRTMIMSYIKKPSCLILAVTAANADLANSDALQIAGIADPDGYRTIGIITKLDIMDRGTDARNLLLGKVIPLRLGYIGVVNRCQEDINLNRTIKDALAAEEKFFRSHPVYNSLADRCGIPQLAKKLNHILVQHIKGILPVLKSRISDTLVSVAKEHASYGEITESKAGQGALLLTIFSKYGKAFSSMLEGENEETSTSQLSGLARIKYVFQSIFVKSLEGVDPCEDLTDDDIRTAIQNACGSNAALFVPVIPFEVLVRRQIARLLYPSLQCARFIYDELIKISHRCLANELQRFPVLRKRMDEVIGNFLRDGLEPSETMVGHLIEMEMDYINTSHPNFIGGTKAVEVAQQQLKSSRANPAISRPKDVTEVDKTPASERSVKTRAILGRSVNVVVPEQQACELYFMMDNLFLNLGPGRSSWGISSIFGGSNSSRFSSEKTATSMEYMDGDYGSDYLSNSLSVIHLQEPPEMLRPSDTPSEQESIEIAVIKLLLRSYYNIVRKNIEDLVPKTIMHFLVQHTKRELHNVLIKKLYRENLFEEMLQEPDEISVKRKQTRDTLRVLQQAFRTLEEMPLEAESVERGQSSGSDTTGLPKMRGFPLSSSIYAAGNSSNGFYAGSPNNHKSRKSSLSSSHSGELQSHYYPMADSNGRGGGYMPSLYPSVD